MIGANVPDLRGVFIRGWDTAGGTAKGIDTGRIFGSYQLDDFKSHSHPRNPNNYAEDIQAAVSLYSTSWRGQGQAGSSLLNGFINTGSTGGTETRPKNIALLPCIKY